MSTYLKAEYKTRGPVPQDVIAPVEFTLGALQADEAILELVASPINPSDVLMLTGQYGMLPPLPAIGGNEGIARIVELGTDVQHLTVGTLVLIPAGNGTWVTHFKVKAAKLSPLPEVPDPHQLSMLTVNPATASLMLSEFVDLKEGDWVIQNAANSGVGTYLIQLAKIRGFKTINIVRRPELVAQLKGIGADAVVVSEGKWWEEVKSITEGQPIKLGIDAVAGKATGLMAQCLGRRGTLINYGMMSGEVARVSPEQLIFQDITVKGFWLVNWFSQASREEQGKLYQELAGYIATGKLSTLIDKVFKVADIKEAVAYANQGGRRGKVLITA
ncbi:MAG: zinc-dependent alcohol dehydrogenase family protein [Bacteroidota bacterium]